MKHIIVSVILGLISLSSLTYSFFTSKEKGPILSNTYLLATAEERKNMNKSSEYHFVTVIFSNLGMIFLLLTIRSITLWLWIDYLVGVLAAIVIVYAISGWIKSEKNM